MATENFQAPGITVRELRAGVPQIRGVPTSIGALLGRALRGPVDKAIRVDSLAKAQRIFGDYDPNSFLMEQVDGYFKNGGSALYLSRSLPTGGGGSNTNASVTQQTGPTAATAASKTSGSAPYNLEPGQTVVVDVDNGGADTVTFDAAAATVTSSGLAITDIDTETLIIELDNDGDVQTITFTATETTAALAAAKVNADLLGGSCTESGGEITITSDKRGTDSEVDIQGGSALVELGLSVGVTAGSGDVADINTVTAAELAARLTADLVTTPPTVTDNGDGTVTLTSPSTGAASELDFTGGSALAAFGYTTETLNGSAAGAAANTVVYSAVGPGSDYNSVKCLSAKEDSKIGIAGSSLAAAIAAGAVTSVQLTASLIASVKVGDTLLFSDSNTGNSVRGVVSRIDDDFVKFEDTPTADVGGLAIADTECTLETWSFSVVEAGRIISGPFYGLRMSSLSAADYFVTRINTDNDEAVVTVTDSGTTVGASGDDNRPTNTVSTGDLLTGGSTMTLYQDTDYIGNASNGRGLYSLDKIRVVRLIAIPGVTGTVTGAVTKGIIDYCATRTDCVAVVAPPLGTSVSGAVTFKNDNVGSSSYGIMHYPYLQILNPLSSQKADTPPEGFIMGMIARTDRERGVAKAPAGEIVGRIVGALDAEAKLTDDDRAQLYPANINPIEDIEGVGIAAMGSRTLEGGEFNQINVRRTFIFLKESIKIGTRFVLFEPNDPATRAKVRRVVFAFLKTEWERGNLEGDTVDDAFFVICDRSNNPENTVNEGKMFINIGVNIPRTTEFLVIEIQQDQRGQEAALGF